MNAPQPQQLYNLIALGQIDVAETSARALIEERPEDADAHHVLGLVAYKRRNFVGAVAAIRHSIELSPNAGAWSNLGAALRGAGLLSQAESAYRKALDLDPACHNALTNLANLIRDFGRSAEAECLVRQAIAAGEQTSEMLTRLGDILFRLGRLVDATNAYQQALSLGPYQSTCVNLAITLAYLGRISEAERFHRMAVDMRPDHAPTYSHMLITLNYHPDHSAEKIFEEYRRFDEMFAAPLTRKSTTHSNGPDPERRLRVGYVSPNFDAHVVAHFTLPLLEMHDREQFDVVCYAEVNREDDVSRRFQSLAHWVSTVGLTDDALAARIRADGIDVLVDLAGQSIGNRLMTFAHKPAPVQLSYMIGHGTTTGLSAMDGFIADEAMIPVGAEHLFSEMPARIGRVPIGYVPPAAMPQIADLPARRNGFVTYGHFGRPIRLNDRVIAAWSEILRRVPNSRLLLNYTVFGDSAVCDIFFRRFAKHGIEPNRLDFRHTSQPKSTWAAYNDVDIALDPFPHNAGTTTIEALWMGVPVVSLADRPSVGRFGLSILGALDLTDWIAGTVEGYINLAVAAASNVEQMAVLRQELRQRFAASPLCDTTGLTREIENVYRKFWRLWCERQKAN